jgi:DNA-binding IclR family transcriptional regulator
MPTKKARVLSVEKAVNILNLFKDNNTLSLNEITNFMDIPKTTAFGLIATLENLDMLNYNSFSGKYELGNNIIELSVAKKSNFILEQEALKQMKILSDKYNKNTHITMLSGKYMIYVDSVSPSGIMANATVIGSRAPANCTSSGKAFLAALSDTQLEEMFHSSTLEKLTPNSITNVDILRDELNTIKKRGYAIDNQESMLGVKGVGAVVLDVHNEPILGISMAGLISYMHDEDMAMYGAEIANTAKLLTEKVAGLA